MAYDATLSVRMLACIAYLFFTKPEEFYNLLVTLTGSIRFSQKFQQSRYSIIPGFTSILKNKKNTF